jgi:hypothetical protein
VNDQPAFVGAEFNESFLRHRHSPPAEIGPAGNSQQLPANRKASNIEQRWHHCNFEFIFQVEKNIALRY